MLGITRGLWLVALLVALAAVLLFVPTVRSDPPRALSIFEERVAWNHSVISVNEGGFDSLADELAIWQTIENIAGGRGAIIEDVADAMDRHSGRATGAERHRTHEYGNHRWSRDLTPACGEPRRWEEITRLPWHFYEPRCLALFARSRHLVRRRPRVRVCRGRPITWGGRYGLDAEMLERRNAAREARGRRPLVQLDCQYRGVHPHNGFYGVAPETGDGA